MDQTSKPPVTLVSLTAVPGEVMGRFHLFALDADGEVWRLDGGNDNPHWAPVPIRRTPPAVEIPQPKESPL